MELRRHKYIGPLILQAIREAAGGPPSISAQPTPESWEEEPAATNVVITDQLEAILNVLNLLVSHADRAATKAQFGVIAARDLLVSKGIVTEEEWDAAIERLEQEHTTLFAMDPDVQSALDEISAARGP